MNALAPMTITGLADRTGVDVEAIRAYERLGFISKPRRGPGGHRLYGGTAAQVLVFVHRAVHLGFTTDAIRELLSIADGRPGTSCKDVNEIALRQLESIRAQRAELMNMERALSELAQRCERQSFASPCPLLASLSGSAGGS